MLALLASGIWVAISLLAVGFLALEVFSPAPAGSLLATTVWDASWNWALTALPLFIRMGEILFRTRLSADMFNGLAPWLSWLPGRLLHVNIVGCGVMAAVAGSSSVTCATVARMSVPELRKRYDEGLSIGTLAGSGTLGLLIPPSIMLIVYGVIAQQSISRLFIAGVLPGVLLVGIFMSHVMLWSLIHPGRTPKSDISLTRADFAFLGLEAVLVVALWAASGSLRGLAAWISAGLAAANPEFDDDVVTTGMLIFGIGLAGTIAIAQISPRTKLLVPVLCLIVAVLGSIYGGVATPTEAATIGVLGALVLAAAGKVLRVLDEDAVRALVPVLERQRVRSVAVGFLHSYANPVHEQRARRILTEGLPDLHVTLSCEACPEIREYERLSTACANAYVQPLMTRYLRRLGAVLRERRIDCPVFLMPSGGGLMTLETGTRFPIRLVESGRAAARWLASTSSARSRWGREARARIRGLPATAAEARTRPSPTRTWCSVASTATGLPAEP